MALEVNWSLSFNFHLINFIKFADDAKRGGVASTLEKRIRIENALDSVENCLKQKDAIQGRQEQRIKLDKTNYVRDGERLAW